MSVLLARDSLKRGAPSRAPALGRGHQRVSGFPSLDREAHGLPLERSKFLQALIDIGAVLFGFLFVLVTAAAIVASVFIMLFVGV